MPTATESLGNLRDVPVRVGWRMIEGTEIGYLAFNVWMVPLMSSKIRPALAELESKGMRALVLDLRGNPGGVGAMSIPMARELSTTKLDLGRLQMRDMAQEYKPEANPEAFDGPVILLVDEGTASTSEIFAMGMRDAGRVKIVGGSTSAGMALPSLMEELPDGGRLQYVVGAYTSPKGTVPEGEGIKPDVLVNETRADYGAGKDPVLEAAVELAHEELEGEE
jgi:carboxyl-terminal processing protease